MKLILHDKSTEEIEDILTAVDDVKIFSAFPRMKPCTGCFGCWIKTPGECVIDDRGREFLRFLAQTDELHVISDLLYGGLSVAVKTVMDRSIGYMLPYFETVKGEMHHPSRYSKTFKIYYHIFIEPYYDADDNEKNNMRGIAEANALNFGAEDFSCDFFSDSEYLKEVFQ